MKNTITPAHTFLLLAFIALILSTGCDMLKLGPAIDKLENNVDTIGMKLASGMLEGIDTTKVDALVERLVARAGETLNDKLDSLSLQNLSDSLKVAIINVLDESMDSIQVFLADTSSLDNIDAKLQSVLNKATDKINATLANLIPRTLNKANTAQLFALRDSLLGDPLANLLQNALVTSLEGVQESGQLDSLISKITQAIDKTKGKVDDTAKDLSKTLIRTGVIIGIIILALAAIFFLFRWLRQRAFSKQQKELLVNLTKAIDAIPSKEGYDRTIEALHQYINHDKNPKQHEMLKDILAEYKDQYPQKQKYKDMHKRMVQHLKANAKDETIRQQLLKNADPDLRNFMEKEM